MMTEEPLEPIVSIGIKPFDLTLPSQLPIPKWNPFPTEAERAQNRLAAAIEAKELAKRLAEEVEVATRRWREVHAFLAAAGNVVGAAVLKLHRPVASYDGIVCTECMTSEDYEATPAPWECATFKVVAAAAKEA